MSKAWIGLGPLFVGEHLGLCILDRELPGSRFSQIHGALSPEQAHLEIRSGLVDKLLFGCGAFLLLPCAGSAAFATGGGMAFHIPGVNRLPSLVLALYQVAVGQSLLECLGG